MSIILKGIDLPNSGQIELIIRPHGKVFSNTRGISAEAIQIPKGHGRLIDGDVVIAEICKEGTMAERQGTYQITICEAKQTAADIVSAIPTILEAEE